MDRSRKLDQPKSSQKKAKDQRKLGKKDKALDKTQGNLIDAKHESNSLNVTRDYGIESSEEKSESSHLSGLPHEQLEDSIEAKKEEKKSFESAYSELLAHITTARQELKKILEKNNLSK